jgi:protein-disulfide isomerase
MSKKKVSKRQLIREKRRRQARMQRFGLIGVVVIGALLVAFTLIYPNLKSVGEIATVEAFPRSMANGTAMGDPNAPVIIDVFEDFQCSACVYYTEETERRISETYVTNGQVYYVFHQYPFLDRASANKESQQAANASMCAMEQDKFWEYHDILFANWNGNNAGAFSDRRLAAFAETLELDMDLFTTCFEENRYQVEIQADYDLGIEMGVSSTPSIFVNEQLVLNSQGANYIPSYEDIVAAIEAALAETGQ